MTLLEDDPTALTFVMELLFDFFSRHLFLLRHKNHFPFLICIFLLKLKAEFCGDIRSSDVFLQAIDHLVNSAAKTHYISGVNISVPIVFRGPNGAALGVGAQHSQVSCISFLVVFLFKETAVMSKDSCEAPAYTKVRSWKKTKQGVDIREVLMLL